MISSASNTLQNRGPGAKRKERSPFSGHTSTAPVLPVARAVWVGALVAAFFVLALLSLACAWLFLF